MRLVVKYYGASQVLVGSHYPFHPATAIDAFADFERAGLAAEVVAAITTTSALRFFGR